MEKDEKHEEQGHVLTYRFCRERTGAWQTGLICPRCDRSRCEGR